MNTSTKTVIGQLLFCIVAWFACPQLSSSAEDKSVPIFENGEAQIVPGFKDPKEWIRHDLFVETEFDSDKRWQERSRACRCLLGPSKRILRD